MNLSAIYSPPHFVQGATEETQQILSGTAEYALRAIVHLARAAGDKPMHANELSEAAQVPRNYMGKILHELARTGILISSRGKHGGFVLAIPPEQLTLGQVVSQFDSMAGERRCLLGRPECSDTDPCATHDRWREVSRKIDQFFRTTTVADVLKDEADAFTQGEGQG